MRRRLLNFLTALSLLACVAVCGVWVRSHSVRDWVGCVQLRRHGDGARGTEWVLWAGEGDAAVAFSRYAWDESPGPFDVDWARQPPVEWVWDRQRVAGGSPVVRPIVPDNEAGFSYRTWDDPVNSDVVRSIGVAFPVWFAALAFAVLPVGRAFRWQMRRGRVRVGRCAACGYDLRATPRRCPECGREATGVG